MHGAHLQGVDSVFLGKGPLGVEPVKQKRVLVVVVCHDHEEQNWSDARALWAVGNTVMSDAP